MENLLHPIVYKEIYSQIAVLSQQADTDIIIIAIPLLFETKNEYKFDRILVVDLPVELQIQRSSKRDHCAPELIRQIINSQVNRQTRLAHADDIIDNSGTLLELQLQVKSLFQYYCSLAHKT